MTPEMRHTVEPLAWHRCTRALASGAVSLYPMRTETSAELDRGSVVHIPGGAAGLRSLDRITVSVPQRGEGRQNWQREQACVVALVRTLLNERPQLFPADLIRGDAPDFVLRPNAAVRPIAIEHTDATAWEFQRVLDAESSYGDLGWVAVGARQGRDGEYEDFDGWAGNEPERRWVADVGRAMLRKSGPSSWRDSPAAAERWLLIADECETAVFVSDAKARAMMADAIRGRHAHYVPFDTVAIVRGLSRIIAVDAAVTP